MEFLHISMSRDWYRLILRLLMPQKPRMSRLLEWGAPEFGIQGKFPLQARSMADR
jgi:hypothetical protein